MKQVEEVELVARLAFDNPWWRELNGIDKQYREWPERDYLPSFLRLVTNTQVHRAVILLGPRRVGKTVMVYQTIQKLITAGIAPNRILYISLETPLYLGLSLERLLGLFRSSHSHNPDEQLYIFFDEIQYFRDWEIHLKSMVDSYKNIRFIATGSAAAALKLKSQESGAGRFTEFMLPPLTFAEYLRFIKKDDELIDRDSTLKDKNFFVAKDVHELNKEFVRYLNYGGYPEAVFIKDVQQESSRYIKSDIIDKVLLRDLPSLYGIEDIQELNRLFTTLAYNTGNEVSLEGLSQSSGVAKNTIKKYLDYLEAAFLIIRITRVDKTIKNFKRTHGFKIYLTNPSMRAALFGPVHEGSSSMGDLTETAVFSQWFHDDNVTNKLHYARWNNGEVDIISPEASWIIEVKWSDRFFENPNELKSLLEFVKDKPKFKEREILVTTKTARGIKTVGDVTFAFKPSSEYCYTVGKNIVFRKTLSPHPSL